MKIVNNFGGIDKEIYNIGDILHKVGKNYLRALPIVCNEDGEDFEDYRIYGSAGGVGNRTANLFNADLEQGTFNSNSGAEIPSSTRVRSKFEDNMIPAGTYTINAAGAERVVVYVYDATKVYLLESSIINWKRLPLTFTTNEAYYVRFAFSYVNDSAITPTDVYNIMLNAGSTPIPYGYEVDMSVKSGNLWNGTISSTNKYLTSDGSENSAGGWGISAAIEIEPETTYTLSNIRGYTPALCFYDEQMEYLSGVQYNSTSQAPTDKKTVISPVNAKYLKFSVIVDEKDVVILDSSTTTTIYIGDAPLGEDEYIDYDSGKIYRMSGSTLTPTDPPVPLPSIPTVNGKTTVNYAGTGTAPEKAWFSGMEFEIEDVYFGDKHIFSVWGRI